MKPRFQDQRNRAWTLAEVVLVIGVLALLAAIFLPVIAMPRRSSRLGCVSNLKQIGLSCRIWAGDHNNKYLMSFSETTNVAEYFQVMSNELVTPKILICPSDREHIPATNFQNDFNDSHISYFINPDAAEAYPQMLMSGDDNFAIGGVPVKSGLLISPSNTSLSWTAARHHSVGNIGFADGSVSEVSTLGLQSALVLSTNGTPITTNRLAIP
jgi:prepilin-type processing-associated H-X9-DG protein